MTLSTLWPALVIPGNKGEPRWGLVRIGSPLRKVPILRRIPLLATALILLAGCAPQPVKDTQEKYLITGTCKGVEVIVNYGILGERTSSCVSSAGEAAAKDILASADITTEGTITYGDQIVCRVNGLPAGDQIVEVPGEAPHTESCADMPPAFAYWALWVKADAESEWEYAAEGVGSLKLNPGQSIGLMFTTGSLAATPN